MQRSAVILSIAAIATFATTGEAQRRDRGDNIPPGHRPPSGMCRVWIDGIAPGLQPKPTDCATAERAAGENARIIYGDRTPFPGKGMDKRRGDRDKDRDHWCNDDARRNHPDCKDRDRDKDRDDDDDDTDRDRDGKWDRSRYPKRLPEMRMAILYQRGRRLEAVRRWVGSRDLRVEVVDSDRNGTPERATWLDQRGKVVQIWIDRNRDGRVDRVEFYDGGRQVHVIE